MTSLLIPISLPTLAVATPSLLLAALESLLEQRLQLDGESLLSVYSSSISDAALIDAVRTSRTHSARRQCLDVLLDVLEEVLAGVDGMASWKKRSRVDAERVLEGAEKEIAKVVWALVAVAKRKGVVGEPGDESGVHSPFVKGSATNATTRFNSRASRSAGRRFGLTSLEPQVSTKLGAMLAPIARRPTTPRSAHRHALAKMTVPVPHPPSQGDISTDVEDDRPLRRGSGALFDDDDPFLSDETRKTLASVEIGEDRPLKRAFSSTPAKVPDTDDQDQSVPQSSIAVAASSSSLCSCDTELSTADRSREPAKHPLSLSALLADLPSLPAPARAGKGSVVVLSALEGASLPLISDDVERFERSTAAVSDQHAPSMAPASLESSTSEAIDDGATVTSLDIGTFFDSSRAASAVNDDTCAFSDSDDEYIRSLKLRKSALQRRLRQMSGSAPSSHGPTSSQGMEQLRSQARLDGAVVRVAVRRRPPEDVNFSGMERRRLSRS